MSDDQPADIRESDPFRTRAMLGALATTFTLGMRHGFDVDHIAAIGDITGSQPDARSSMRSATLYALGHGAIVVALGSIALVSGATLPSGVDVVMERVVGATLVLLAGWIVVGLLRQRRDFRLRSRWTVLAGLLARRGRNGAPVVVEHDHAHDHGGGHDHAHDPSDALNEALDEALDHERHSLATHTTHRHRHTHVGAMPRDPFVSSSGRTSVAIGLLHGFGAETGTQVIVFVAAVEAGGTFAGELVLLAFVLGVLASNTAVAALSTFGFRRASAAFPLYVALAVVTALFSAVTGLRYLGLT